MANCSQETQLSTLKMSQSSCKLKKYNSDSQTLQPDGLTGVTQTTKYLRFELEILQSQIQHQTATQS
jgi:hypothetical protein